MFWHNVAAQTHRDGAEAEQTSPSGDRAWVVESE
jgi:hypothetical protein